MAETITEKVTLTVADGTSMDAFVARPAGGDKSPGLMIFQEAFGVTAHIRDVAARFARQGYVAIAPELFHRTAPGAELSYTDFPAVMPHMQALTNENQQSDIRAAFSWLQKDSQADSDRVGCIGFCMGGANILSGVWGCSAASRCFVLRRRNWTQQSRPISLAARAAAECADAVFLGRPR